MWIISVCLCGLFVLFFIISLSLYFENGPIELCNLLASIAIGIDFYWLFSEYYLINLKIRTILIVNIFVQKIPLVSSWWFIGFDDLVWIRYELRNIITCNLFKILNFKEDTKIWDSNFTSSFEQLFGIKNLFFEF